MIIAVDFDGTVVEHRYPKIGDEIPNCVNVLKKLLKNGHKLILYTMRSGSTLDRAVEWFKDRDIELWGINHNPEQYTWTDSNKVYANIYIDDAGINCPMKDGSVDWFSIDRLLG